MDGDERAHSTGAILALTYLYDHPEAADRVILSAPCLILTFEAPAAKVFIGKVFSSILPKVTLQAGFDPGSVSRDPAVVEANKKDELVTQAISTRFYTEVYGKAMPAALARIEELKLPTLVIQGTRDLLVSPKVAEFMPMNRIASSACSQLQATLSIVWCSPAWKASGRCTSTKPKNRGRRQ